MQHPTRRPDGVERVTYDAPDLRERLAAGALERLVLRYEDGASDAVKRLAALHGVARAERLDGSPLVIAYLDGAVSPGALEALRGLSVVHEDIVLRAHRDEALALIGQSASLKLGPMAGQGVNIAVLDTGVDVSHADFGACLSAGAPGCRVRHAEEVAQDDHEQDDDGHGSNVAAIAAKVAPGSQIVALDVFDGQVARSSDLLLALDWVLSHRQSHSIGVVNLSLGTGRYTQACSSSPLALAASALRQSGVIVIASSGNDGFNDGLSTPACAPSVMSVGAVYDGDIGGALYDSCADATSRADQVTCFSNVSSELDLVAPGISWSAGGATMSGTSQAAPVVAAMAAALKSLYPQESPTQITARLKRSAPVLDLRSGLSFARVSFEDALDSTPAQPPPLVVRGRVIVNSDRPATRASRVSVLIAAREQGRPGSLASACLEVHAEGEGGASPATPPLSATAPCRSSWRPLTGAIQEVALPDEPGRYTISVSVESSDGRRAMRALRATVQLDRQAPQDGRSALSPRAGGSAELLIEHADDGPEGSGVAGYRVYARRGAAPPDCLGLPSSTRLYSGPLPDGLRLRHAAGIVYRVCAYDQAGNLSTGSVHALTP